MPNWKALYISIKNIINNFALNRYVWFSLHHFRIPQYFLHPSRKLPAAIVTWSNSLLRNSSFLTTSTPSTSATTSAEKSHAFAKSSYSHRLMFFFGVSTEGTEAMRRWGVVKPRRTSSSSDNSDTFSGSILSTANFGIRDSSLRYFRILFMMFSSFTS